MKQKKSGQIIKDVGFRKIDKKLNKKDLEGQKYLRKVMNKTFSKYNVFKDKYLDELLKTN